MCSFLEDMDSFMEDMDSSICMSRLLSIYDDEFFYKEGEGACSYCAVS